MAWGSATDWLVRYQESNMDADEAWRELNEPAWRHIGAKDFAQAEPLVRQLIDITASEDCLRLSNLFGVLAGVLTELERHEEATEMLRRALAEACRGGPSMSVEGARYMLANQHLFHGDPCDAVAVAKPVPSGMGHTQCLLHSVVALAHWKLGNHDEAATSAQHALNAAPQRTGRSP
jgi:tetratricopeptide (TPR) repeat protein